MEHHAGLTHLNESGEAHMVDVGAKEPTKRRAIAGGTVVMRPETLAAITDGQIPKGDVFAAARIAGIMAAKQTSSLIPLCHPLLLTKLSVEFESQGPREGSTSGNNGIAEVDITATVELTGKTGVEMEALTAVSVAALTIYDMCKAIDKGMTITNVRLLRKEGGKSGTYVREDHTNHERAE